MPNWLCFAFFMFSHRQRGCRAYVKRQLRIFRLATQAIKPELSLLHFPLRRCVAANHGNGVLSIYEQNIEPSGRVVQLHTLNTTDIAAATKKYKKKKVERRLAPRKGLIEMGDVVETTSLEVSGTIWATGRRSRNSDERRPLPPKIAFSPCGRGNLAVMRKLAIILLPLVLAACSFVEGIAAPRSELVSRHWLADDPASTQRVDHAAWSRFLAQYLVPGGDGVNRIGYARAKASGRAQLDGYIAALEAVPVSRLARDEQRAYWINLYNAVTTRIVLDHYPVKSIRDISLGPGLFSFGPWDAKVVTVEGERLSLNDIEHGILRPIWRDPRLHYALNCAAVSCPSLAPVAFTAANTERLLDEGARAYVNNPRGVRITDGRLTVSSIYLWYRADFGDGDAAVIDHLERYAAPALKAELARFRAPDHYAYDWRLIDLK